MTISSSIRKAGPYTGNDVTTAFPFAFKVFVAADVSVILTVVATGVETTLVITTDYTIALNADQNASPGGTITYNPSGTPMAATHTLTIGSVVTNTQGTHIVNGGAFLANLIENMVDRVTIEVQQEAEKVDRSLKIAFSDSIASVEIPPLEQRRNRSLGFDNNGELTTGPTSVSVYGVRVERQIATAAQTVFNLANSYTPGVNSISIFVNGLRQVNTIDYNETTDTSITFVSGLSLNDEVVFVSGQESAASTMLASAVSYTPALPSAEVTDVQTKLQERLSALDFPGMDKTGSSFSDDGFDLVVAEMPNPSTLDVPYGTYLFERGISIPYSGVNGSGKTINFEGCTLKAGANGVTLLHWSDSGGAITGKCKFDGNGFTGCSGMRVTPEDEASTTVIANQNFNQFGFEAEFIALDEGIVWQAGPRVTGTDSGCWYNQFTGSRRFTSCKRAEWFKDGNLGPGSGPNSNTCSGGTVINGSMNTGIQIDAGGDIKHSYAKFENITLGSSPNATPVAYKVANLMLNGGSNNDNALLFPHWENCTQWADINNNSTLIITTEAEIFNTGGQLIPYVEQYKNVLAHKGALLNAIYGIVTDGNNIKGLWLFDEFSNAVSAVNDRSTKGHTVTLRDAALATQVASLWGPRISGVSQALTYSDESHLWDTPNHADFNFGDGAGDNPFSIVTLVYPTRAADCEIVAKDDLTSGSTKRQFSFSLSASGAMSMNLFDDSAGSNIGRTMAASVTANAVHVLGTTYDGSSASGGVKLYLEGTQVDNANSQSGVYTAMEALTAKVGGYRVSAGGAGERSFRGRIFATLIVAEELTGLQMRRLSYLLRTYAGVGLN